MTLISDLFFNYIILAFIITWVISILLKAYLKSKDSGNRFNISDGLATGGMPSSHSAVVAALTTAIYLNSGVSEIFAVALVFSLIIISDAFGVRRNVGIQGDGLNALLKKSKMKTIKVAYGHSFMQVICGLILGIAVSVILFYII